MAEGRQTFKKNNPTPTTPREPKNADSILPIWNTIARVADPDPGSGAF